jgi:hypothetical protein
VCFQVPPQPFQVYPPRIIATPWLRLNVPGFPVPSQQSADSRFAHTKQRRRRRVRTAFLRLVRSYQTSSEIDGDVRHPDLRSHLIDRVNLKAV